MTDVEKRFVEGFRVCLEGPFLARGKTERLKKLCEQLPRQRARGASSHEDGGNRCAGGHLEKGFRLSDGFLYDTFLQLP